MCVKFLWSFVKLNLLQYGQCSHYSVCILRYCNDNWLPSKPVPLCELPVANSRRFVALGWWYCIHPTFVWYGYNLIVFFDVSFWISSRSLRWKYRQLDFDVPGNLQLRFAISAIYRVSNSLYRSRHFPGYFTESMACTNSPRACQSASRPRRCYHRPPFQGQANGSRPCPIIEYAVFNSRHIYRNGKTNNICHVPVRVFKRYIVRLVNFRRIFLLFSCRIIPTFIGILTVKSYLV